MYPSGARWTWRYGNSTGCADPSDGTLLRAVGSTPTPMPLDWSPRGTLPH
jgi:hypothetical protein